MCLLCFGVRLEDRNEKPEGNDKHNFKKGEQGTFGYCCSIFNDETANGLITRQPVYVLHHAYVFLAVYSTR